MTVVFLWDKRWWGPQRLKGKQPEGTIELCDEIFLIVDFRLQIAEWEVSGVGCQVSGKKNKKAETLVIGISD
jgi:hypothetical protein